MPDTRETSPHLEVTLVLVRLDHGAGFKAAPVLCAGKHCWSEFEAKRPNNEAGNSLRWE
jgi:hypothetical protein